MIEIKRIKSKLDIPSLWIEIQQDHVHEYSLNLLSQDFCSPRFLHTWWTSARKIFYANWELLKKKKADTNWLVEI